MATICGPVEQDGLRPTRIRILIPHQQEAVLQGGRRFRFDLLRARVFGHVAGHPSTGLHAAVLLALIAMGVRILTEIAQGGGGGRG